MNDLRLVIFEVDGTLADSQDDILAAMTAAFGAVELPAPSRAAVLGIVGLSLDIAEARLAPGLPASAQAEIVAALRQTGINVRNAVMVGDTSYDMEMARAAGIAAIDVSWGCHRAERLSAAHHVIDDIHVLPDLRGTMWEAA